MILQWGIIYLNKNSEVPITTPIACYPRAVMCSVGSGTGWASASLCIRHNGITPSIVVASSISFNISANWWLIGFSG